jgi:hypothetical protein
MIRDIVGRHLQALYDARTPILEDDGRLMWVNAVSWTSIVGEPWDGQYL